MKEHDEVAQPDETPVRAPSGLVRRAARSSVWSILGQVAQFALGIASVALLTRWVSPADYGLVGMASVLTGFLGVVGDSGIGAALVRRRTVDSETEANAFWVALVGAGVLAGVCLLGSPLLGKMFGDRRVMLLAIGLALTFPIAAPGRVPMALLQKDLRFGTASVITLASSAAGVGVACGCGAMGLGPWTLVAQILSTFGFQSIASCVARPYSIRPSLVSRGAARDLASFGSNVGGFSLAMTAARLLDNVLGGRWIGPTGLGWFGMAMRVFVVPLGRLCSAISSVLLPTLAAVEGSTAQARAFTGLVRLSALVTIPVSVGVAVSAPELEALLPSRWSGVADPLRVFAIGSVADAVTWYSIAFLLARGRARALLVLGTVLIPISWLAVGVGSASGHAQSLAAGWVTWHVAHAAGLLYLVSREIPLGRDFWLALLRPLGAAAVMGACVRAVVHVTGTQRSGAGAAVGIATGILVYGAEVLVAMRSDAARLLALARADSVSIEVGRSEDAGAAS